MSTYNGKIYVEEQIQSILNQKGVECHLLIRDDGSKDGTTAFVRDVSSRFPNGVVAVLDGENVGVFDSFTELVKYAANKFNDYDYYAFSDQDDIWLSNKVLSAIDILSAKPNNKPLVYCSNSTLIDNNRRKIKNLWGDNEAQVTKERILFVNYAQGCTMVFNKIALDFYNRKAFHLGKLHDYMMALIGVYYGEIVYDENSYLLYRQHENNVIGGNKKRYSYFQMIRNLLTFRSRKDEFCRGILDNLKDLCKEDQRQIEIIANYKKNILSRMRLLIHRPLYYKSFGENLLLGVRVLLGTF